MIPFGTHVTARWTDGRFYVGRVIHVAKDVSRYLIHWEHASPIWVEAKHVSLERRPAGPSLAQMARMFGVPDDEPVEEAAAGAPAGPDQEPG